MNSEQNFHGLAGSGKGCFFLNLVAEASDDTQGGKECGHSTGAFSASIYAPLLVELGYSIEDQDSVHRLTFSASAQRYLEMNVSLQNDNPPHQTNFPSVGVRTTQE